MEGGNELPKKNDLDEQKEKKNYFHAKKSRVAIWRRSRKVHNTAEGTHLS